MIELIVVIGVCACMLELLNIVGGFSSYYVSGCLGWDHIVEFKLAWDLELLESSRFQVGESGNLVVGRPYANVQLLARFLQFKASA